MKSLMFTICAWGVQAEDITVFAAASLKNAFEELAQEYQAQTGTNVVLSTGGSAALARQIQFGAPADVFVSANVAWMDAMSAGGYILPDTRFDMAGNTLVLIGHGAHTPQTLSRAFPLAEKLDGGYLAMGFVDAVPAGIYGKAALEALDLWAPVQGRIAQSDSVRGALALVATGEAPLGIVYGTDAAIDDRVSVIGTFAPDDLPAITYPAAAVSEDGRAFVAFLGGASAQEILLRHGFTPAEAHK